MDRTNRLALDGTLIARDALRYTPAGIALLRFTLAHDSLQTEAEEARRVTMEMPCLAAEATARAVLASPLGARVQASGFIAPKSVSSRLPVFHVTELIFKEGI